MSPRKKKTEPDLVEDQVVSADPAPAEDQSVPNEPVPDAVEPVVRHRDDDILSLSDQERGFTEDSSEDVKWNFLAGAMRRHVVLTGIISGVEYLESANPICAVDYCGIRIVIPARELFMQSWPDGEKPPKDLQIRLHRILGATVDFMLEGVDSKNHVAAGSRRRAMLRLQNRYYRTGRVKEGILVACRVIGVGGNRVSVEALGADVDISGSDVSWRWYPDVRELYSAGDIVVARVMSVAEDPDTGTFIPKLSIKAATRNPDEVAAEKLIPGSDYFGVVTGIHNRMIFLRLQAGFNIKTTSYSMKEPPHKLDTVCFHVQRISPETGMVYGIITRVIKTNKLR